MCEFECGAELESVFLIEDEEPVEGKKRKGKASRPLRIDLILQHDSLVPPPKESVSIITLCALPIFYRLLTQDIVRKYKVSSQKSFGGWILI